MIIAFQRETLYEPHLAMFSGVYDAGNVRNSDASLSDIGRCEGNDEWLREAGEYTNL